MSGGSHPYEFHRGELIIRYPREHYHIRAWPGPQALTSEDGLEWKRCWPEFRFIAHPAPPMPVLDPMPIVRKPKRVKVGGQLELALQVPTAPKQTKDDAFELLRQTLPPEVAESLAPFDSCQWNPLVFVHFDRGFLDLLKSSPALAYYLANDRDVSLRIYRERQTFLPKLIGTKQVDLLDYVGLGCRKQMVGIVKKIRAESADMGNVAELQNVRGNEEALKRLSHLKSINRGVLAMVGEGERLLKYYAPSFLDEVSQDETNHFAPAIYGQFGLCLRMHWALHPRLEFPRMQTLAGFHDYFDELAREQDRLNEVRINREMDGRRTEEAREIMRRPFPTPPIPSSADIQALDSDDQLSQEGLKQHNCVGSYRLEVRRGSIYLYRVLKPERATLSIFKDSRKWHVNELKATCNRPAKPATLLNVKAWLNANQLGSSV